MSTESDARAAKKSKSEICRALMELLRTTPYEKLTVCRVCGAAGVSRPTFYKNFKTMDDVVRCRLLQLKKSYDRRHSGEDEFRDRLAAFYTFVRSTPEIGLLLTQRRLSPIFEKIVRDSYLEQLQKAGGPVSDGALRGYLPGYLSATIVSLLRKWAEDGYRETPEQMAEIAVHLTEGYHTLLPRQTEAGGTAGSLGEQAQQVSDILDNIPTGVCVLFMPDPAHQEIRFANKQQMRLISPNMPAPEKVDPRLSVLRAGYYKNAFSGVHPDDLPAALEAFRDGFQLRQFRVPPIRLLTGSGSYVWVSIDVTLRESRPDGKLFYVSYRDISREIQLQQELDRQRQKNLEGTLLDTIGHLPACSILYREKEDGTIVPERFSREYLRFRGYAEGETPGAKENGFLQTVHPDDRSNVLQALETSHGGRGLYPVIIRIRIRGDGYKWVSANFTRFSFSEMNYLYVVFTDIDDLKKQEQLLQKQYDNAQSFLDSVADTYLMTQRSNLTQNKVEALRGRGSPPANWEGRSYDELVERLMREIKGKEDRKSCAELLDRSCLLSTFEKGIRTVTREFRSSPAGQDPLWLQGVTTLSKHPESGDVFSFFALSSIREKKLTEAIINNIVAEQCDYVCCIDAKMQRFVLFIPNKRWDGKETVQAGCDYETALNTIFIQYVLPDEQAAYREFMDLSRVLPPLEKQSSVTALFHSEESSGTRVKQLEFSYLDRANGLVALVNTDITETQRQQLEQEERLRRALDHAERANAAKSDFLSSMSHDLRTPLNGVLGFTAFALREKDPQKKQEYLEKIESSGKLLLDLINDTLDLSRIESGKAVPEPEAVMSDELIPAVVTALRPSAELKGVRLTEDLREYRNEPVWADKLKINKIALNLLSNSIKFTPSGGTITITPRCGGPAGDNCSFVIADTGIGMSEEFMQRMYEPFSQEKRSELIPSPGTGLGLSIVRRYVDLLGGTIAVESHLHQGTRWTVSIPVTKLRGGLEEKPRAAAPGALRGLRVLLCEDNRMNVEIASMLLKDKEMLVEVAENGEDGLERFSASACGYYNAVLMDIQMPVMNGYEAARRIRALDRPDAGTVPIIAMTADAFEESIRGAKDAGMNAYLTKPIEPQKMYETLQDFMKK